jgi:hypothetical protein
MPDPESPRRRRTNRGDRQPAPRDGLTEALDRVAYAELVDGLPRFEPV